MRRLAGRLLSFPPEDRPGSHGAAMPPDGISRKDLAPGLEAMADFSASMLPPLVRPHTEITIFFVHLFCIFCSDVLTCGT
jgi:hypothetical protein